MPRAEQINVRSRLALTVEQVTAIELVGRADSDKQILVDRRQGRPQIETVTKIVFTHGCIPGRRSGRLSPKNTVNLMKASNGYDGGCRVTVAQRVIAGRTGHRPATRDPVPPASAPLYSGTDYQSR